MKPPISYNEVIVLPDKEENNFYWSGVVDRAPMEMVPIKTLSGRFVVPVECSQNHGLPQELRDQLYILRGPMRAGSDDYPIIKYYMDTEVLSCCDFQDHTNFH